MHSSRTTGETTEAVESAIGDWSEIAREWFLVILFHPDPTRIGESALIPADEGCLSLGRHQPLFSASQAERADTGPAVARALDDVQVSRDAVTLRSQGDDWRLERGVGRSRLRVGGEVVQHSIDLARENLEDGQVLMLGNRTLLHLRLQSSPVTRECTPSVPGLLGVSRSMVETREAIARAARRSDDVLILGPTGTGKGVVASAIHEQSNLAAGPWVAVNMAALPSELAAASLFGTRRGAFTGAERAQRGYFQEAAGGTLFLDEIGDTPAAIQPLLLRALQDRELQVVGGGIERVSVRVIAATERDPDAAESTLRGALRHRLGAIEIRLAPLRRRAEDVAVIAATTFSSLVGQGAQHWPAGDFGDAELARWALCFEQLSLYSWPGNVRELLHLVAQISAASEDRLCVPAELATRLASVAQSVAEPLAVAEPTSTVSQSMSSISDEAFVAAWEAGNFEVAAVARILGTTRAAIYRRLRTLGECRLAADVPLGELLKALDECRGDLAITAERLAVSRRGLQTRLRASGVAAGDTGPGGRVSEG